MDSSIETAEHNFTFAGIVDELIEVVRSWRWSLPGDPELTTVGLSRSYLTNQAGWLLPSNNPNEWTTKKIDDGNRIHVGKVNLHEEGAVIRRVTLSVSLLSYEEETVPWQMEGWEPTLRWQYHPGAYGSVTLILDSAPQATIIEGRLQFPIVLDDECNKLLDSLKKWKPNNALPARSADVDPDALLAALAKPRTDRGTAAWWAELEQWWQQYSHRYTWSELSEKIGYADSHLKRKLSAKREMT